MQNDAGYLREVQYRDASNLGARISLHDRFGTNPQGWMRWAFEQFSFPAAGGDVLEVGCGPAVLWAKNLDRLPAGVRFVLTDFSPGMVEAARRALGEHPAFDFRVADIQDLPFDAARFDAVIASFMLYHVPDIDRGLREVRRVLKPGGVFYAATVGRRHLADITDLVRRFDPRTRYSTGSLAGRFGVENGMAVLRRHFSRVTSRVFDDNLIVPEAGALVAYVRSMLPENEPLEGERLAAFERFVEEQLAAHGPLHVQKSQCLFEATGEGGA